MRKVKEDRSQAATATDNGFIRRWALVVPRSAEFA
jgi:hypothetical protein